MTRLQSNIIKSSSGFCSKGKNTKAIIFNFNALEDHLYSLEKYALKKACSVGDRLF
jgi:hypothetical protein